MQVRFTRSSRQHRIGRAHALHVMNSCEPIAVVANEGDRALRWEGRDDRGLLLEVVAVEKPDCLLVIHVMPLEW